MPHHKSSRKGFVASFKNLVERDRKEALEKGAEDEVDDEREAGIGAGGIGKISHEPKGASNNVGPVRDGIPVPVDIKPGSCPNPLNVKSRGILPAAILGSADFDIEQIDTATRWLS